MTLAQEDVAGDEDGEVGEAAVEAEAGGGVVQGTTSPALLRMYTTFWLRLRIFRFEDKDRDDRHLGDVGGAQRGTTDKICRSPRCSILTGPT